MPKQNGSIGHRIRELRLKNGLSQTELARQLGCAQNTITEWEKRKGRAPSKKILGKVASCLGVSVDYLLGAEKIGHSQIPCYGEVPSEEFIWSEIKDPIYYIEVPPNEYSSSRFSLKLLDDLLEPAICEGDYAIFDSLPPEDGDIIIVRFPKDNDKALIRMWRQEGKKVMLSETKLYKNCPPYFLDLTQRANKKLKYLTTTNQTITIEGKLVAVKKVIRSIKSPSRITYIF